MEAITILHISDVHFGQLDLSAEQPETARRLIEAAHKQDENQGFCPDLCVFSGDLVHSGCHTQFRDAEAWLSELLKPWPNCRLFVVPGNHEVQRPPDHEKDATRDWLHGACTGEREYNGRRRRFGTDWDRLDEFRKWHENARDGNRLPLISDWSKTTFGCRWRGKFGDLDVLLIGLNTVLASCDDNEEGKLVADLRTLNKFLSKVEPDDTLTIVVAHHPVAKSPNPWLAEWNREQLEKRLSQETGAHLYLHGHLHESEGHSMSTFTGHFLTVLAAGAAYQRSEYPQRFAFFQIDCDNQEIRPRTFQFYDNGRWGRDTERSRPFRAVLPRTGLRTFQTKASPVLEASDIGQPIPLAEAAAEEGVGKRVIAELEDVAGWCECVFRVHPLGRVNRDASGQGPPLEILVLTHSFSGIPRTAELIAEWLSEQSKNPGSFAPKPSRIQIADTGKSNEDGLKELFAQKWKDVEVTPEHADTFPWFRLTLGPGEDVNGGTGSIENIRISVNTILRETRCALLGRFDTITTERNLDPALTGDYGRMLKYLLECCEMQLQTIEKIGTLSTAPGNSGQATPEPAVPLANDSSDEAEREFREVGMPPNVRQPFAMALKKRHEAKQRWEEFHDTVPFGNAAQAFRAFKEGLPSSLGDRQREVAEYWADEEQVYCLLSSKLPDRLDSAQSLIHHSLEIYVDDALFSYHSAKLALEKRDFEHAVDQFKEVVKVLENKLDPKHEQRQWLIPNAFRYLGIALWRLAENQEKVKDLQFRGSLTGAIQAARNALEQVPESEPLLRAKTLNDLLYYHTVEIAWNREDATRTLPDETVKAYAAEFQEFMKSSELEVYEPWDTLTRVLYYTGGSTKKSAGEAASRVYRFVVAKLDHGDDLTADEQDALRFSRKVRRELGISP